MVANTNNKYTDLTTLFHWCILCRVVTVGDDPAFQMHGITFQLRDFRPHWWQLLPHADFLSPPVPFQLMGAAFGSEDDG